MDTTMHDAPRFIQVVYINKRNTVGRSFATLHFNRLDCLQRTKHLRLVFGETGLELDRVSTVVVHILMETLFP